MTVRVCFRAEYGSRHLKRLVKSVQGVGSKQKWCKQAILALFKDWKATMEPWIHRYGYAGCDVRSRECWRDM